MVSLTPTIVLLSATLFTIGLLIGWIISKDSERSTKAKMQTMVAVVITLGWISATAAGIFITEYSVSPMLHALMGAIVGYFFTEDGITFNLGKGK